MNNQLLPDPVLNIELSVDGKNYYKLSLLSIPESKTVEKEISLFIARLKGQRVIQENINLEVENQLYLRVKSFESDKINNDLIIQQALYQTLTIKEKTVLCFLGKGHKPNQTAEILKISMNTLFQHQKCIYRKMDFNCKFQMTIWCEKYLSQLFDLK